ncbi:nucleoside hydrolase [Haloarcula rubripromontorii]|uniref:Nucleoside hydrolase n=1 Tax=Haloarcula rubripromontorii TaxID=1705562 RepID=A0A847U352_9EURY|nr:nucleoside hydrolase [Haloarcula rubripromontorii]NLV07116.1 nucleoside hydrolase [Haloarcula rubripromontorii]
MRRVIIDTDTAGDDTQAILLSCLSDRVTVDAITVVAGNVPFDREVENAKYTLEIADSLDVPVYEGARQPLIKEFEHATYIHGEDGLGGDLFPETDIESATGFGPDEIVARCRAAPGEITLLCIGPLTNLALAYAREPDLPDLVDEVWVMGGNVNCEGNVTPAAEFNLWVDPDAAKRVFDAFEVTLVDWGVCLRDAVFGAAEFEMVSTLDTELASFFESVTEQARAFNSEESDDPGWTALPDSVTAALLAYPELREAVSTYHVAVDDREGLTRGYTSVDVNGVTDGDPNTHVVESVDSDAFQSVMYSLLQSRDPDSGIAE